MHIAHVAIWTNDLERLKTFYETYFEARANDKYTNPGKQFQSYFLTFASGARLELMHAPTLIDRAGDSTGQPAGYSHLAFSVGSPECVDRLTERLRRDGYRVVSAPRRTGDGYYESCVLDCDGNRVEIIA